MVHAMTAATFSAGLALGLCLGLAANMLVPSPTEASKEKKQAAKKQGGFPRGLAFLTVAVALVGIAASYQKDIVDELRGGKDILVAKKQTAFQRLVATKYEAARGLFDYRLFLDGFLQFSSMDEHRYNEALVHPAFMVPVSPSVCLGMY